MVRVLTVVLALGVGGLAAAAPSAKGAKGARVEGRTEVEGKTHGVEGRRVEVRERAEEVRANIAGRSVAQSGPGISTANRPSLARRFGTAATLMLALSSAVPSTASAGTLEAFRPVAEAAMPRTLEVAQQHSEAADALGKEILSTTVGVFEESLQSNLDVEGSEKVVMAGILDNSVSAAYEWSRQSEARDNYLTFLQSVREKSKESQSLADAVTAALIERGLRQADGQEDGDEKDRVCKFRGVGSFGRA